jgi:hypothetical protein
MTKCYFWSVLRTQKNSTNLAVPLGTPYLEVSLKKPRLWQVVGLRGSFQVGDCWFLFRDFVVVVVSVHVTSLSECYAETMQGGD